MNIQAMNRYINFLRLKHKYKNLILIPTLEIQYGTPTFFLILLLVLYFNILLVWVCHMLRPSMYIRDCKAMFDTVIDHSIMLNSTYEYLNKVQREKFKLFNDIWQANLLAQTAKLYQQEYGSSMEYCYYETIGIWK